MADSYYESWEKFREFAKPYLSSDDPVVAYQIESIFFRAYLIAMDTTLQIGEKADELGALVEELHKVRERLHEEFLRLSALEKA